MNTWLTLAAASSGNPLLDWLSQAGALGVLAFVVLAFMRRWIVTGAEAERCKQERDRALELLYEMARVSSQSLDLAGTAGKVKKP